MRLEPHSSLCAWHQQSCCKIVVQNEFTNTPTRRFLWQRWVKQTRTFCEHSCTMRATVLSILEVIIALEWSWMVRRTRCNEMKHVLLSCPSANAVQVYSLNLVHVQWVSLTMLVRWWSLPSSSGACKYFERGPVPIKPCTVESRQNVLYLLQPAKCQLYLSSKEGAQDVVGTFYAGRVFLFCCFLHFSLLTVGMPFIFLTENLDSSTFVQFRKGLHWELNVVSFTTSLSAE